MGNKYSLGEVVHIKEFGLLSRGVGEIFWWYVKEDVKMDISNTSGKGFHIFTVKGARVGHIWRGRGTKDKGGTVTVIPPLQLCTIGEFEVPEELADELARKFEPEKILVDTGEGIRRLIKNNEEEKHVYGHKSKVFPRA